MSTTEQDYKNKYVDINNIGSIGLDEEEEKKIKEEHTKKQADILLKTKDDAIQKEKIEDAREKGQELGQQLGEELNNQVERQLDKKQAQQPKFDDINAPHNDEPEIENINAPHKDEPEIVNINEIKNEEPQVEQQQEPQVSPEYHPDYQHGFDRKEHTRYLLEKFSKDPKYAEHFVDGKPTAEFKRNVGDCMDIVHNMYVMESRRHPEYYENPLMSQERIDILSCCVLNYNGLLPADSDEAMIANEHPAVGLNGVEKTLTDLHKDPNTGEMNVRMEALFGNGFVVDEKGQLIKGGRRPWEQLDYANKMIMEGKTIHAMSRTGKVIDIKLGDPVTKPKGITAPQMEFTPLESRMPGKLVDQKVKAETIAQLTEIEKTLNETGVTRGDSEQFAQYKECVKRTKESLTTTVFKSDFDKQLDILLDTGNQYYFAKTGQSKNARRIKRCDTCNKLKQLVTAAKKDQVPSKEIYSTQDSIRRDIASKAVKAFAVSNKDSKDPTKQAMSEEMLSDSEMFDKEVDKALRDPGFVAMFGGKGSKAVSVEQLRKISQQSGKDICKAVVVKNKELHEAGLEQTKQATSRESKHARGTRWQEVSVPVKKGAAEQIADMKEKIEKMTRAYEGNPAFDELRHQVEIADIRLQGGAKQNVHYPRMMAKIADAADKFAKTTLPTKSGKKAEKIFDLTQQARDLYDDVSNNKVPGEKHLSDIQKSQKMLAEKLALRTAEKLQKSDIRANKAFGEQMMANRQTFEAATKEIMESKAFRSMTHVKGDPEAAEMNITDLLSVNTKELEKIFNTFIISNKGRENPNAVKSFERLKENEQKQAKKDELNKVKESEQTLAFSR